MKKILVFLLATFSTVAQGLIPQPVSFKQKSGSFKFTGNPGFVLSPSNVETQQIASVFSQSLGFGTVSKSNSSGRISLIINQNQDPELKAEGYKLSVTSDKIKISANDGAGLFYGLQSLMQMIENQRVFSSLNISGSFVPKVIKACEVMDYPRFGWRGLMLDVSRHFFTKKEVMDYIDLMAKYKYNTFHWHLTDDNGWRIEIKAFPKLTSVGAWRVPRVGHYGNRELPKEGEAATYGGFYTQDDIREVVKYAQQRFVTIVPEIDVPGHSLAWLAAYPEYSTLKKPASVNPGTAFSEWYPDGTFKMLLENTLNPADEKVYDMLDKIFTEVAALFPNPYIHMGGDEAYHGYWEADPSCQALMKREGLKNTQELQSYFVKRVEKIVNAKGKTLLGWDEILEGGLAPNAVVMSWRGEKGGIEAAKQKHKVVMTPNNFCYIDYVQGDWSVEPHVYASLSLRKAYEFEPVPAGIESQYILGGQANLWTEQIQNYRHATYMTYPRALATSEVLWSPKSNRNWDDFVERVEKQFDKFEAQKIQISKAVYDPIISVQKDKDGTTLLVTLTSEMKGSKVYYTLDDSFPDSFAPEYKEVIKIPKGDVKLQTINYRNGKPLGRLLQVKYDDLLKRVK